MAVQITSPEIRVEPGMARITFEVTGQLQGELGPELVGKVRCAFCGYGPMTVSAAPGRWETGYCPTCCGKHEYTPAADVPAELAEVA